MITDIKEALREVRRNKPCYENIADDLWYNIKFLEAAIKAHTEAYNHVPKEMKLNNAVVNAVISKMGEYNNTITIDDFPDELKKNKEIIKKILSVNGSLLRQIDDLYSDDREIVMCAVKSSGSAYQFISERLKSDKELAITALRNDYSAYKHMSDDMKVDIDVASIMAKNCTEHELKHYEFSKELFKNPDVVTALIENKKISAIRKMKILPDSALTDKEYILSILKRKEIDCNLLFSIIPQSVLSDKNFAFQLININPVVYNYLPHNLRMNANIAALVIEKDIEMAKYIPAGAFDNHRDIVMKAVQEDGTVLKEEAFRSFNDDSEIAMNAVLSDGKAYSYISERLKNDENIMLATISENVACLVFTKNPELCNDKEFMKKAIAANKNSLVYASKKLKNDKDFALDILPLLQSVDNQVVNPLGRFYANKDFVLKAIKDKPEWIKFAADSLKYDGNFIATAIKVNPDVRLYCEQERKDQVKHRQTKDEQEL
ncbi:MAG: DUF4116 domain-containing protein [Acutalibacteraceae bacterium]|nr:DUF4116 domain-containing protein [Acutalibacteraceae bacterium]